ncbi:DUF4397 domain-containing protein [Natronosalvus hydrolyticus]|uniref:DUF4397 domain-containing protein n=1 Tax=Natronosalvus hydrolyticus TaxID=2979988 RepID=UPI003CCC6957
MTTDQTRRRLLTVVGSSGVLALAGCLGGDDEDAEGNGETDDGMDDHDDGMDDHDDMGEYDDEYDDEEADHQDEDDATDADVRVAHLSPDAANVDIWIDGEAVLEDVPFRAVSEYLELPTGTYEVAIAAAGEPDTVVFEEDLEILEGAFTVAALGELSEENQPFAPDVFADDVSDPGDEARVRLVHASPDAPAVDVTVGDGDTVLYEDVAFGETASVEVPAGSYTLEVRPATADNDGDVVATFDVEPAAGNVYTAFAVGYLDAENAPADEPFDLEVVLDAEYDGEAADAEDGGGAADAVETVFVGPDGQNSFDPDTLEIEAGTTVRFTWDSSGHNVSPVSMPDGADWEGEPSISDAGHEHEHTFEVTGRYEYVCDPHEGAGMTGEIHVE